MKITRTLTAESVRALCIRKDYYTKGTNEEYSKLLGRVDDKGMENWCDSEIEHVALNILDHSDAERLANQCGGDLQDVHNNILFELLNDCCKYFAD